MKQDSGMGRGSMGGMDKDFHSSHTTLLGYFYKEVCGAFGKVGHREEGAPFEYIVSHFLLEVTAAQGSINCLLLSRVFHS